MPGDPERGRQKVDWARAHMPVLEGIRRRFETEHPFSGLTLSAVLHVEAKTAALALALRAGGADVRLAHPLGVKAFSCRRVKNDERDCAGLAGLLRLGRLPEAWIAPPQVRELRELTRYRIKLVRLRSSAKDRVHAVLAKPGIAVPCSGLSGGFGSAWLDGLGLPQPYAGKTGSLRRLTGWLTSEITQTAPCEPCGARARHVSEALRSRSTHLLVQLAKPLASPDNAPSHFRRAQPSRSDHQPAGPRDCQMTLR